MLDTLDYKIIEQLSRHGRKTWAELAIYLGISAPSVADRVKKLEEKGVINGYSARFNYTALGYMLIAFISINLSHPRYIQDFLNQVNQISEIEECHHVAGESDYFLKVRCTTTQHLDELLNQLKMIEGVSKTRTTIVLSSNKENSFIKFKE